MMQVIYIDILFLINFIMDCMIFYIAIQIGGNKISYLRLLAGSAIASLAYCGIIYFPILQKLPVYIYYLFIPVIPILYMFKPTTIKDFIKEFIICTMSAFVIGGGSFSFYYLIVQLKINSNLVTVIPVIVGGLICIVVTLSFKWIRRMIILPRFSYQAIIYNINKKENLEGIVDTGNCLYTLISHKPVSIIEYEKAKKLLKQNQIELIETCLRDGIIETISKKNTVSIPVYIIPFKSLGCKEGVILGVEIEQIKIIKNNYEQVCNKCVIGICFEPIFKECKYQMLIHPELIIN
ncbi:MAG: sigma-E processing peptidase SpoIIGA [Cellulosilyticaceae bacterium]